jgi:hypothetical protein
VSPQKPAERRTASSARKAHVVLFQHYADGSKLSDLVIAEIEDVPKILKFGLVGGICGSLIRSNGGGSPVRSARELVRASAPCCSQPVAF